MYGGELIVMVAIASNQIRAMHPELDDTDAARIQWVKEWFGRAMVEALGGWGDEFLGTLDVGWSVSNPQENEGDVPHARAWCTFRYGQAT